MNVSKVVDSIYFKNCKNTVINIACQNVKTTISGRRQRRTSRSSSYTRVRLSKPHFVRVWMEHYHEGLDRIADMTGMTANAVWVKYCVFRACGVILPPPGGHNPFEFSSAEVSQLNDLVRTNLS